jgi:hypothetical protein
MSNIFSGLTAFVNEARFRNAFWTEALMSNDVLPFVNQYGFPIPNMKEDSLKLPKLSAVVGIADGSTCSDDFDNGNDTTITQSTVTQVKGLIQDSICPHDGFETYFTALGMPDGQHYRSLGEWQAPLMGEINRMVARRFPINFWTGNESPDTWTFPGWIDQLLAANMGVFDPVTNVNGGIVGAGATPTSGGAAGTDAAGVYNIVEALIQAALTSPDFASDVAAGNVYVVMNPLNKEFMRQNYQKRFGLAFPTIVPGLAGLQNDASAVQYFPGWNVPVVMQNGIPQSTIILSRKKNQVAAFDLLSDYTRMDVWLADDHDTIRWKMRFKTGVAWRALDGRNIKYYGPTS